MNMSYTVFALKWRPKNFDEIVGQGHIVTTLKNAIQKNRLAHAYLFAGARGVGKTSTARILAKALNCKDGPTLSPCHKCVSCIEISQGRSFDVIEIDGASNRGIDEIRALRENVKFPPASGNFKVYIIDEVHMLTQEAFNALLKTLEEPPEFVKFIFATTQPHKIIPTILSRCQRLDFRRISTVEIINQLQKIIAQDKIKVDDEVLLAIAKSSDGSLRDAESLLDQLTSFSKDKISLKDVISILGIVEQEALFEITDKIIQKESRQALEMLNNIIDEGKDVNVFLHNLIEHFRNLMVAKITQADSKLIDLPQDLCERLLKQAQGFNLAEIFTVFNTLVNAQEMSKRIESLRIPLEIAMVKLTHDKKNQNPVSIPKVENKPWQNQKAEESEIKETKDSQTSSDNGPISSKENTDDSISLDVIKNAWPNVIDSLGRVKMYVGTYLNEGNLIKAENNVLTVSFPKNYSLHKESLERKENKAIIEKVLFDIFKANIRINLVLSKETADKKETENSPFLKSALEAFGARVIKEQ